MRQTRTVTYMRDDVDDGGTEPGPEQDVVRPWKPWQLATITAVAVVALFAGIWWVAGQEERDVTGACREAVLQQLAAPASAEFGDLHLEETSTGYKVTGYVDAQNLMGALIRNKITCTVTRPYGPWTADAYISRY